MPENLAVSLVIDVSASNLAAATGWKPILLWSLGHPVGWGVR
jgi:hypothetical protein